MCLIVTELDFYSTVIQYTYCWHAFWGTVGVLCVSLPCCPSVYTPPGPGTPGSPKIFACSCLFGIANGAVVPKTFLFRGATRYTRPRPLFLLPQSSHTCKAHGQCLAKIFFTCVHLIWCYNKCSVSFGSEFLLYFQFLSAYAFVFE